MNKPDKLFMVQTNDTPIALAYTLDEAVKLLNEYYKKGGCNFFVKDGQIGTDMDNISIIHKTIINKTYFIISGELYKFNCFHDVITIGQMDIGVLLTK